MSVGFIGENAAENLVGLHLNDWLVTERIGRTESDTGGFFSVSYRVERDGVSAYCKVLNYFWMLQATDLDPLEALNHATSVYQFERDLLRQCRPLSRVITSVDDGSVRIPGYRQDLVSYIVFEVAECDVRRFMNNSHQIDIATQLRLLHHLAVALRQLHGIGVAHQDVKPSNLLVFPAGVTGTFEGRSAKIGDLGRATSQSKPMWHDDLNIVGARSYAPVEALYGSVPTGFGPRRLACDLYQLGSMTYFLFTSTTLNAALEQELHPSHSWGNWTGSYDDVRPYVRDAFVRVLERLAIEIDSPLSTEIVALVEQLCEPDPLRRGHRVNVSRPGNSYDLERIVTEFDRLASKAEAIARASR